VDALTADILNQANHRCVEVGNFYYKGVTLNVTVPYGQLVLPDDEITPTINSINQIATYINNNLLNTPQLSSIKTEVTSRIADVVYPLQNGGSLSPYVPAGSASSDDIEIANVLLNNRSIIQQRVSNYVYRMGYLSVTPPNPRLLQLCTRDIGLMVDSVANDLSSGVMSRSIEYALAYWNGSTSRLTNIVPNQVNKTLDTINFLNNTIDQILVTNGFLSASRQFVKIKNSLENFKKIIVDVNNVPITTPQNHSGARAARSILNYKSQLQQQIVEYVKHTHPTTLNDNALSAKCYRDVGYIVDALAADISNYANHRSIDVGDMYFKGTLMGKTNPNSNVPTLPQDQIDVTISAINALTFYINGTNIPNYVPSFTTNGILSSIELGSERISDVNARISNITYPLQNNGSLNAYSPTGSPTQTDIDVANLLQQNRSNIQSKISKYVTDNGYLVLDSTLAATLSTKCYRDTGFIIDAIAADIENNTNHRSIDVSDIYFKGTLSSIPINALTIPQDQLQPTIQAISALSIYINGTNIPDLPVPFTTTGILSSYEVGKARKYDVVSRVDDIVYTLSNNGFKRDYNPLGTPTPEDIKLSYELLDIKTQAQSAISTYVRNKGYIEYFPKPDPTLTAKCTRDIGLIVDAVVNDLASGVNSRSIQYALAYWEGSTSRLPDSSVPDQKNKTIDTINFIGSTILDLCQNQTNYTTDQSNKILNSLNNFNRVILSLNDVPITKPSGTHIDPSYEIASQRILDFKPILQQQVIEYANYYYPSALTGSYSLSAKCYRDVGYIVDAIAADIKNNTNHRSIEVGNMYFKGTLMGKTNPNSSVPTLPKNQIKATIAAIESLGYYINGITIPAEPYSFTKTGILSSVETGKARSEDVSKRIANILYPIQNNGLLNSYLPNGNPLNTDIQIANFIANNRDYIQRKVAQYVYNRGYLTIQPPSNINSILIDKCKRDIGYMVDAVASDLLTGVTSKTIQYALAYWDGNTTRIPDSDIPNQTRNTLDTIDQLNNYLVSNAPDSLLSLRLSTYPLQFLVNFIGLNSDLNQDAWQHYYEFFDYIPKTNGLQQNNVIDFDNPLTTLNSNLSSVYDWLGHEQLTDVLFSYNLYRGLGIIE